MDGCAANLDSDRRIEDTYGGLEGFEPEVLVGEQAVLAALDTEGDSYGDVVLVGAEPGIALGLLEDVMEEGVVAVVVHDCQGCTVRAGLEGYM